MKVSQQAELRRDPLSLHMSSVSLEHQMFFQTPEIKKAVLPRQCNIPNSLQESSDVRQKRAGGIISLSVKPRVNGLEPKSRGIVESHKICSSCFSSQYSKNGSLLKNTVFLLKNPTFPLSEPAISLIVTCSGGSDTCAD